MKTVYIFSYIDFDGYCELYNQARRKEVIQKYIKKHEKNKEVQFKQSYLKDDSDAVVIHVYDTTDGESTTIPMKEELSLQDNDEFYKNKVEEYLKQGKITKKELQEFLSLYD